MMMNTRCSNLYFLKIILNSKSTSTLSQGPLLSKAPPRALFPSTSPISRGSAVFPVARKYKSLRTITSLSPNVHKVLPVRRTLKTFRGIAFVLPHFTRWLRSPQQGRSHGPRHPSGRCWHCVWTARPCKGHPHPEGLRRGSTVCPRAPALKIKEFKHSSLFTSAESHHCSS